MQWIDGPDASKSAGHVSALWATAVWAITVWIFAGGLLLCFASCGFGLNLFSISFVFWVPREGTGGVMGPPRMKSLTVFPALSTAEHEPSRKPVSSKTIIRYMPRA
jgi:hypothetical protein